MADELPVHYRGGLGKSERSELLGASAFYVRAWVTHIHVTATSSGHVTQVATVEGTARFSLCPWRLGQTFLPLELERALDQHKSDKTTIPAEFRIEL